MVEKVMNTVKTVKPQKTKRDIPELYLKIGTDLKRVTWLQLFLPRVAKAAKFLEKRNQEAMTERNDKNFGGIKKLIKFELLFVKINLFLCKTLKQYIVT